MTGTQTGTFTSTERVVLMGFTYSETDWTIDFAKISGSDVAGRSTALYNHNPTSLHVGAAMREDDDSGFDTGILVYEFNTDSFTWHRIRTEDDG